MIRLFKARPNIPYGQMASNIFASETFSQRNVLNEEGHTIGMDAKGSQENKRFWRIVALPGQEIIEYYVPTRETADLFDEIVDSVCFRVP